MNKDQLLNAVGTLHEAFSDEAVILIDGNTITVEFEGKQLRVATITKNFTNQNGYEVETLDRRGAEDKSFRYEKITIEEIVDFIKETLTN